MKLVAIDESEHIPDSDVTVTLEVGWPKSRAIASTIIDGKTIAQVGEGSSKHLGTLLAGVAAKRQALARLKAAIILYVRTQNTPNPVEK